MAHLEARWQEARAALEEEKVRREGAETEREDARGTATHQRGRAEIAEQNARQLGEAVGLTERFAPAPCALCSDYFRLLLMMMMMMMMMVMTMMMLVFCRRPCAETCCCAPQAGAGGGRGGGAASGSAGARAAREPHACAQGEEGYERGARLGNGREGGV